MAAKGQKSKNIITECLLKGFSGAFINNKEIRIPMIEDSEQIEIKVTLTRANDVLGGADKQRSVYEITPPTEEEKQAVSDYLHRLGLM